MSKILTELSKTNYSDQKVVLREKVELTALTVSGLSRFFAILDNPFDNSSNLDKFTPCDKIISYSLKCKYQDVKVKIDDLYKLLVSNVSELVHIKYNQIFLDDKLVYTFDTNLENRFCITLDFVDFKKNINALKSFNKQAIFKIPLEKNNKLGIQVFLDKIPRDNFMLVWFSIKHC